MKDLIIIEKVETDQVLGSEFRSSNAQIAEEATDPSSNNPSNDKHQERCTNVIHDSLEVTLILGALDESCGTSDERSTSTSRAKSWKMLAAFRNQERKF